MSRTRWLTALGVALVVTVPVSSSVSLAADWPHWRGPNRDGKSAETGVLPRSGFGLEIVWTKPIGSGNASFSIVRGRLFTLTSDGENDVVMALDAETGRELWRRPLAPMYEGREGGSPPGPTSTPTVDGDLVFALGPRGQLVCLRFADGSTVWSRHVAEQDQGRRPFYGFTTSPTVVGKAVLVQTAGPEGHSLSSFDKTTGALLWSAGDDEVGYQSPLVVTLAGQPQLLVVTTKHAYGILPETGTTLWQVEVPNKDAQSQFTQPVAVGDDRFLLTSRRHGLTALFRVTKAGKTFSASEVWRANVFGNNTYSIPIYHDGYLYGFHGNFLSCVDAATGKNTWKSRKPGGRGLVLVDLHLVILEPKGSLVIAEATPEGYREKARLPVLNAAAHSLPSFANGRFFVRNLSDAAAVAVTAEKPDAPIVAEREAALGRFAETLAELEAASDKRAAVDAFLQAQAGFPIVEDGRYVHFVYRGNAKDVGLRGSMVDYFPLDNSVTMARLAGTDLFYRSYEVDRDARWNYEFMIDFETFVTDPLNPWTVPSGRGRDLSELRMPDWPAPRHVDEEPPAGTPRGRIEAPPFQSQILEGERAVKVYLPAGYDESEARYPLLIANNGPTWLELGLMQRSLDNLIGKSVRPVIVCFVPVLEFAEESGKLGPKFIDMLVEELVPFLDRRYRTTARASERAILGASRWSLVPLQAALRNPETFSLVAAHSPNLGSPWGQELLAFIAVAEKKPLLTYVDWNRWESRGDAPRGDPRHGGFELRQALEQRGYETRGGEFNTGSGWGSWRARTDRVLEAFFPLPTQSASSRSPSRCSIQGSSEGWPCRPSA